MHYSAEGESASSFRACVVFICVYSVVHRCWRVSVFLKITVKSARPVFVLTVFRPYIPRMPPASLLSGTAPIIKLTSR